MIVMDFSNLRAAMCSLMKKRLIESKIEKFELVLEDLKRCGKHHKITVIS
jgi:hypothetical protein